MNYKIYRQQVNLLPKITVFRDRASITISATRIVMRDLGSMGESTFCLWCADAGLIPNGSKIDKTGWDFLVEFPFNTSNDPTDIHKPAFECKVQVKATDKTEKKLQITLSNLRRLITAQMPSFFVFMEFDGGATVQRAFIVHVGNELISKVLKRLHEVDQGDEENKFNKRKITIHYDESHMMQDLNGACLKDVLLSHIGNNMAEYIANKKHHLESTGFENGFAQINFVAEGEENLKKLIDASVGIEAEVSISHFKGTQTRFGIASRTPFVDAIDGKLKMSTLKPHAEGIVRFKEDKLSAGWSFISKLYISPFNHFVPEEFQKLRVEGEFFDLQFNPYTGFARGLFSIGEGVRLEVRKFRDTVKLLTLLGSSGKKLYTELIFEGFPKLVFEVGCTENGFDFSRELKALECAVKLMSDFDVTDHIDIELAELVSYEEEIFHMESFIRKLPEQFIFIVEFSLDRDEYNLNYETACVFLKFTPIGSHIFGMLFVMIGTVEKIESERYRLMTKDIIIEKRIVLEKHEPIPKEDLLLAIEDVEKKYGGDYLVFTMLDKKEYAQK